jgi:xyloglucan-specific exo-beta-1,4-glucanase
LRSTDSGATFTKVSTVTSGINVPFGKAAPGASHPAVFLVGTVDGVTGVFRSDDTGTSWVRVNDDAHQYGNAGEALAADPNVYGRVYLGTNGRGILYADRQGGATSSPTSSPSSSSPSPSPSTSSPSPSPSTSSPSPSASTTKAPGGGCTATYKITSQWSGGFQGEVTVTDTGTTSIKGWRVGWTFGAGQSIQQTWNGLETQSGAAVTVTNVSYNGALGAGAGTTFGFLAALTSTNNPVPSPLTCTPTS